MPIEFQPAAPTGVNAAASYGQAQQSAQDMPVTANLYEAQARLAQQAQLAGQEQTQRSNEAATQAQLQDRHQQVAAAGQQDQLALGREALAQHSADIDRHAEAQAYVRQRDLTFQDQLHKQQLDSALSEVDKAYANGTGTIDQDTYTAMVLKIKAQLDPIEMKHQAALSKLRTAQTTDLTEQAKLRAALSNTDAAVRAKAANQLTFNLTNPATGKLFTDPATGEPMAYHLDQHSVPVPVNGKAAGAVADKQQKAELDQMKADRQEEDAWQKRFDAAEGQLRKEAAAKAQAKAAAKPDPDPGWDGTNIVENARERMREKGQPGTLAELRQQRDARRPGRAAAGAGGGDVGAGGDYGPEPGGGPPPAASPPPPAAREFAEKNRPFDPVKWEAEATDEQKVAVRNWNAVGKNAELYTQDPEQLRGYRASAAWAARALAAYGSVPRMPPAVQQQYQQIKAAMAPFLEPPPGRPAPRPTAPLADAGYTS